MAAPASTSPPGRKRPLFTDARLPEEVRAHLASYYGDAHVAAIEAALVVPPSQTTIRVNTAVTSRERLLRELNEALADSDDGGGGGVACVASAHPVVPDLVTIEVSGPNSVPELPLAALVDVGCAEAVLRGADIFAPGLVALSAGVEANDEVSVYAQQFGSQLTKGIKLKPGLLRASGARHVGNGRALLSRDSVFGKGSGERPPRGLAIRMGERIFSSPPLRDVLADRMFLQNLPSMIAGHALTPIPPGARVLDMCAAPGGKTTHLAALQPGASVVALDRSAKRLALVAELAARLRTSNVQTRCMSATDAPATFGPESFDCVLLDPPCSALGLRPRLNWRVTRAELRSNAALQRSMLRAAYDMLKPGGTLVYSTCTINPEENEENVAFALATFPELRLTAAPIQLGEPGVPVGGLTAEQAALVQRFDPSTPSGGTSIGFFVARFERRAQPALADGAPRATASEA